MLKAKAHTNAPNQREVQAQETVQQFTLRHGIIRFGWEFWENQVLGKLDLWEKILWETEIGNKNVGNILHWENGFGKNDR